MGTLSFAVPRLQLHVLPLPPPASLHWSPLSIHTRCSLCLDAGSSTSPGKLLCIFQNSVRGQKPSLSTHPRHAAGWPGCPISSLSQGSLWEAGSPEVRSSILGPSASKGPRMKGWLGHCFGGWKEREEERKGEREGKGKYTKLNTLTEVAQLQESWSWASSTGHTTAEPVFFPIIPPPCH